MLPPEVTSRLVAQLSLADYTQPSLIVPKLGAVDTPGIIAELSHMLQKQGCVSDMLPLYHAALNNELMNSTAQACGIAFPHARLNDVKRLQFAIGFAPHPVVWGSNLSFRVRVVFLLAVPSMDATGYLHLLASIVRLGQQPDFLEQIQGANTASEIMSLLRLMTIRQ